MSCYRLWWSSVFPFSCDKNDCGPWKAIFKWLKKVPRSFESDCNSFYALLMEMISNLLNLIYPVINTRAYTTFCIYSKSIPRLIIKIEFQFFSQHWLIHLTHNVLLDINQDKINKKYEIKIHSYQFVNGHFLRWTNAISPISSQFVNLFYAMRAFFCRIRTGPTENLLHAIGNFVVKPNLITSDFSITKQRQLAQLAPPKTVKCPLEKMHPTRFAFQPPNSQTPLFFIVWKARIVPWLCLKTVHTISSKLHGNNGPMHFLVRCSSVKGNTIEMH